MLKRIKKKKSIDIRQNKQTKITSPPNGQGDYDPHYIKTIDKLVWFKSESIEGKNDRGLRTLMEHMQQNGWKMWTQKIRIEVAK